MDFLNIRKKYNEGGNRVRKIKKHFISKIKVTATLQEDFRNPNALRCKDLAEVMAEIIESQWFQQ